MLNFFALPIFFKNHLFSILSLSLVCFGIISLVKSFNVVGVYSKVFCFWFVGCVYVPFLSMILGFEFYLMAVMFILFGVNGFLSNVNRMNDISGVVYVVMGFLSVFLEDLVFVAVMIGVVLIFEGFSLVNIEMDNMSQSTTRVSFYEGSENLRKRVLNVLVALAINVMFMCLISNHKNIKIRISML